MPDPLDLDAIQQLYDQLPDRGPWRLIGSGEITRAITESRAERGGATGGEG